MHRFLPLLAGLLSLLPLPGAAQVVNLGNPPVFNFSKQQTEAGTQTWDVSQDANGITWFANNGGLMEFDGEHWRVHPLSNSTIVRSVRADADGRVYVGGQDEMGCFAPNQEGRMQYQSFKGLLPEGEQHLGEVWDIETLPGEGVFFRTDRQVFRYHNQQLVSLFPPQKNLKFMGKLAGKIIVQDETSRFWVFEKDRFKPLEAPDNFPHDIIAGMLDWSADTLLIATIHQGLFYFDGAGFQHWPTANDELLRTKRILSAAMLPNGHIAIGTALDGFVVLDRRRRVLHHLNKKSGLQNNTVLSLLVTANGSVWLGLDNGIDYVDPDSPFSTFYPDGDLQGTGYAVQTHRGKIYFGTNTGLYVIDWKPYYTPEEKQRFHRVQNADGQVWSLSTVGGALLMGHHEGAFQIEGEQALSLTRMKGVWRFFEWTPELSVAGHYNGFALFRKNGAGWTYDKTLQGFGESSRILATDARGAVWMAHPYRGIYKMDLQPEAGTAQATFYDTTSGLPSNLGNHLFQLGKQIAFATEKGIMRFDDATAHFVQDTGFVRIFGENVRVKYLFQDAADNIWYQTAKETGVLIVENGALEKSVKRVPIAELKSRLTEGFQCIYPIDGENVIVATEKGFLHFNLRKYRSSSANPLQVVLHEVRLKGVSDSTLFGGHHAGAMREIRLSHRQNSLSFSFAAPGYPGRASFVRYSHFLDGIGRREWSEWSAETEVTFNHLPPGDYVFRIKARNQHGVESPEVVFPFTILPPWYASQWAYTMYWLLLAGAVGWMLLRQRRRYEREKQNLQDLHRHREAEHQQEVRRSEAVISQLQQEKLEAEIEHKSEELASMAMHLVQKNAILQSMQEALDRLRKKVSHAPDLEKEINRIARMIESDANMDADWEHFSQNFDQVHREFLKRLSESYPYLSPSDYKLCAYLRLNLSSKEIATLMNISLRGVETGRYRLRKRLNLPTETNLTDFLMRF